MDCKGNILDIDVGNLKKSSFGSVKVVKNRGFKYYVTCREVIEWSMRKFFKEYIPDVARTYYGIIGLIFALIGIISVAWGITILLPSWVWVIIGIIVLIYAQFLVYDKVRKELDKFRNPVLGAISELESKIIILEEQSINMATLYWKIGDCFLDGILPRSIPGSIYSVVQGANERDCHKAFDGLKHRLRLLGLIDDKQRQIRSTGYKEIQTTELGASVLKELKRRYGDENG